jgi:cbb3-type cytochrome oxidase maturation protein
MTSLLVLLPVSLLLLGLAVATLAWATRHGQFEDLEAASIDILVDDDAPRAAVAIAAGTDDAG